MTPAAPAFACRMCGECCRGEGGIVVTREEQERLSRLLDMDLESFCRRYTTSVGEKRVLATGQDGYCIFFVKDRGCNVHSDKPDICRAWPFFRGNLIDAISWEMAQESCPGIEPGVGHREFVRQGCAYLLRHGLTRSRRPDVAAALIIDCRDLE